jgi:hypothetical protein
VKGKPGEIELAFAGRTILLSQIRVFFFFLAYGGFPLNEKAVPCRLLQRKLGHRVVEAPILLAYFIIPFRL